MLLGVEEPLSYGSSPRVADLISKRIKATGSRYQRISFSLVNMAPTRPLNLSDPRDRVYRNGLGTLDVAVKAAVANGLEPIVMVEGTPSWAWRPGRSAALRDCPRRRRVKRRWVTPPCLVRDYPSAWAPRADAVRGIAAALATRYDGNHSNGLTKDLLPRVSFFQAWNEPNLAVHMLPQKIGRRVVSADQYREILNAFSAGAKAGGRTWVKVIAAGLGPIIVPGGTPPQEFIRAIFCLRKQGRRLVKTGGCSRPARFDVWSQHPYDIAGSPDRPANPGKGNGRIADLPAIRLLVDRATAVGTALPRQPHGLWVTEFDWWTNPPGGPHRLGQKPAIAARWTTDSLWRMWNSGVSTVIWHRLRDEPSQWPGGLWFARSSPAPRYLTLTQLRSDRPKPVLSSFIWPFRTVAGGQPYAWGIVPCRRGGRTVSIFMKKRGRWLAVSRTRSAQSGVFTAALPARGKGRGIWSAVASPSCGGRSPEWDGKWG